MRKVISAVVADRGKVDELHHKGFSYSEIFDMFAGGQPITMTPAQAREWKKNGFAEWAGRRRMLITARREAKLTDLSARVGFDAKGNVIKGHGETGEQVRARTAQGEGPSPMHIGERRRTDWIGPFLRAQFLKRPRKTSKRRM